MKLWYVGILTLGAFLIGGLVCRGDRSGEAAQRTADSLAVALKAAQAADAKRAGLVRADSQRLALMARVTMQLTQHGRATERRLDSLQRLVIDTATVVPRALHDSLVSGWRDLLGVREAERDSARSEVVIWQRQALAADSSAQRWQILATAYRVQLGAALKRSKWGCYGGVGASLGYGFVGDRPGVGTVAGLSVTCGKRL